MSAFPCAISRSLLKVTSLRNALTLVNHKVFSLSGPSYQSCVNQRLSRLYSSFIRPRLATQKHLSGPEKGALFQVQSILPNKSLVQQQVRFKPTLNQLRRRKPGPRKRKPKRVIPWKQRILRGPQRKGVCVKLVTRTPKKPNSAQRKCAILRLNDGRLVTAYIPGEKGVLQEHGVVLFEGGRVQDCPGIKYKIIRRKYDMN